jgi:filamentous hemagglutinin family protein
MTTSRTTVPSLIISLLGSLGCVFPCLAQISPDTTLPVNSQVSVDGNTFSIEAGTAAGSNLFHSFTQFNIPTGSEAFFNNSPNIDNIITRVTGGQLSNIDGILRANGTANLFLLNPSGIVFGPNARLDIGGSFFGSTADSIQFADGSTFSATEPNTPPLLTINVPIGLQFGANPGTIRVEGSGHNIRQASSLSPLVRGNTTAGWSVKPGQTLALVGGDLVFEGGVAIADSGRIELGSTAGGQVGLSSTPSGWQLDYTDIQTFRDIRLRDRSLADASGLGSGSIQVRGRNVKLEDGSVMMVQNQGIQSAGSIRVIASQSLEIGGSVPVGVLPSTIRTETLGLGRGGDIEVSTQRLAIRDGGMISARTFSDAPGGNQKIDASESFELRGFLATDPTFNSTVNVLALGNGRAGNLSISTGRFVVTDGGIATVVTLGAGDGGNATIRADSIELAGVVPGLFTPSIVGSATVGTGRGGNLTIDTARLMVRDGGRVDASTVGPGDAGSVTIRARESVTVSGTVPGSINPSLIISSANIADEITRQVFGLPDRPTGNSGDVQIETPVLNVTNGALVNVRHDGSGDAGTLSIHVDQIRLDTQGGIIATTESGEGGHIALQVHDTLQMRHQSHISSTAGGTGNGGNITIDTPTLVALDNSDISANAGQGQGGRVRITTQGIFGTAFRETLTPESDITATSARGAEFNGIVEIQTPDTEPNAGLVELSANPINADNLVTRGCASDRGNRFVVTGRGGLPDDPTAMLRENPSWADDRDWRDLDAQASVSMSVATPEPRKLVEATGWLRREDGVVELVAAVSASSWEMGNGCQPRSLTELEGNSYNQD